MRPSAIESLRGVQAALATVILPELQTMFAQDSAQTLQMLIESIAGEWDTTAEDLRRDNLALQEMLDQAQRALSALPKGNESAASVVKEIDGALAAPADDSVALSALSARNARLRAALEALLVFLEDAAGAPGAEPLMALRRSAYEHLREVALRGWSFWDMMSFRERMASARAERR